MTYEGRGGDSREEEDQKGRMLDRSISLGMEDKGVWV